MERNEAIALIRQSLRERSGKSWSVRGGSGTAWGWIDISAPPRRLVGGSLTAADRAELGQLLGLGRPTSGDGVSVGASTNHRLEYVARAAGRVPEVTGTSYWD